MVSAPPDLVLPRVRFGLEPDLQEGSAFRQKRTFGLIEGDRGWSAWMPAQMYGAVRTHATPTPNVLSPGRNPMRLS